MCLKPNNNKPTKKKYFKLFVEKDGELYWLIRNQEGGMSLGKDLVKTNNWLKATSEGFHVWETKKDTIKFAKSIRELSFFEDCKGKIVLKEVALKGFINGGTCPCTYKGNKGYIHAVLSDQTLLIEKQAFTYEQMKVTI